MFVEVVAIGVARSLSERQSGQGGEKHLERNTDLRAGQMCADAEMQATAEACVLGRGARGVEAMRRVKDLWVAVGRT